MIKAKQGKSVLGMSLTPQQVCDAEFVASWMKRPLKLQPIRPPSAPKSGGVPAGSPLVKRRGGTRNHLQWLQIKLHLEDRVVNP